MLYRTLYVNVVTYFSFNTQRQIKFLCKYHAENTASIKEDVKIVFTDVYALNIMGFTNILFYTWHFEITNEKNITPLLRI